MTPLQNEFARLVGQVLGRQWFNEQRQRAKRKNDRSTGENVTSWQKSDDASAVGKKQGGDALSYEDGQS